MEEIPSRFMTLLLEMQHLYLVGPKCGSKGLEGAEREIQQDQDLMLILFKG